MNSSSATGGTLIPNPLKPQLTTTPPGLTLVQFLQVLFVALSVLPKTMVRPSWQAEPPKEPDIFVNWIAFGIKNIIPDANAYQSQSDGSVATLQRQETIEVALSVYGPEALNNVTLIRDGLQIPQNTAALRAANMGYVSDTPALHVPDFINERWLDRFEVSFTFHRYVQWTYPILSFVSATGIVYSQTAANDNQQTPWSVEGA